MPPILPAWLWFHGEEGTPMLFTWHKVQGGGYPLYNLGEDFAQTVLYHLWLSVHDLYDQAYTECCGDSSVELLYKAAKLRSQHSAVLVWWQCFGRPREDAGGGIWQMKRPIVSVCSLCVVIFTDNISSTGQMIPFNTKTTGLGALYICTSI